jgi:hypothetical protein
LMSAPRIETLGSADYGTAGMHFGVNIWGGHPWGGGDGHKALTDFADARRAEGYHLSPPPLPEILAARRTTDSPR